MCQDRFAWLGCSYNVACAVYVGDIPQPVRDKVLSKRGTINIVVHSRKQGEELRIFLADIFAFTQYFWNCE
jgi:hypothetical protein